MSDPRNATDDSGNEEPKVNYDDEEPEDTGDWEQRDGGLGGYETRER